MIAPPKVTHNPATPVIQQGPLHLTPLGNDQFKTHAFGLPIILTLPYTCPACGDLCGHLFEPNGDGEALCLGCCLDREGMEREEEADWGAEIEATFATCGFD